MTFFKHKSHIGKIKIKRKIKKYHSQTIFYFYLPTISYLQRSNDFLIFIPLLTTTLCFGYHP